MKDFNCPVSRPRVEKQWIRDLLHEINNAKFYSDRISVVGKKLKELGIEVEV